MTPTPLFHVPQERACLRRIPSGWHALHIVCAVVLVSFPTASHAEPIRWRNDYATALKEAAQRGVPLFINVGTTECFWCKQLDARTFIDEEITRLLNDRCIPLKLDANLSSNEYIVQALKVHSYPTLIYASYDGSILGYKEGFLEAPALKEQLGKVLAAVGTPDWMNRDYELAAKAITALEYPKAISLLKPIVEDGKTRPVQVRARTLLSEFEKHASNALARARELVAKGKTADAIIELDHLAKVYAGTPPVSQALVLRGEIASKPAGADDRKKKAKELLEQARDDYKNHHYLCALDRCEDLVARFADLPEATAADKLAAEIKENPEWTKKACEQLSDRMGVLYLALADSWMKKGQPQQAIYYLERVSKMFPGTRHADLAQSRLARLKGAPTASERK